MKSLIAFLIFSAQGTSADTYIFGTIKRDTTTLKDQRITISTGAVKNGQLRSNKIRLMLNKVSMQRLRREVRGGVNAGALICEQQSGGYVVVGINAKSKNENSFCVIGANVLIDTGTLQYYALKNDRSQPIQPLVN